MGSRDAAEGCREGHVHLLSSLSPLRMASEWAGECLVPPGTGQK